MIKKLILFTGLIAMVTATQARPNVIFVTLDDLNRDSLGIHGSVVPDISPHMDKLAQEGLRFEHAHVSAANCSPSRAVMMSGKYSHNNLVKAVSNTGSGNHDAFPVLPDVFNAAGFHTGIMGKVSHMTPYAPYAGWAVVYDGSSRDPEQVYTNVATAFKDAAQADKPLYFNLNLYDPHTGWYMWDHKLGHPRNAKSKNGLAKNAKEVAPSRIYKRDEVPYPSFFPKLNASEMEVNYAPGYNLMDEVAAYYNTVKRADDSIGRLRDAIADAGVTDNTIIVLNCDHGMQLAGAKTQLYNHSTHSPMFVFWPGVTKPNTVNDTHMISTVDLLPTFCEMIGHPISANLDGKSFIPIIKGDDPDGWREFIYKEHSGHTMRGVQTKEMLYLFNPWSDGVRTPSTVTKSNASWKAIESAAKSETNYEARMWAKQFEHRTVEELYDMVKDPDCKINLIGNAAYAKQLASLQATMKQIMIDSHDDKILVAFNNRADASALEKFMTADVAERRDVKKIPHRTRTVFFDPHDDWQEIGATLFEGGDWGIWKAEGADIKLNSKKGSQAYGKTCVDLKSGASRIVVKKALDISIFNKLKLDLILDGKAAFSNGSTVDFQYKDGSGWKTFQTISATDRKTGGANLTFDLKGKGLPGALLFGIKANIKGDESIYMDCVRLTGWQDWAKAPTDAPFDATELGHIRLAFDFETKNFSSTDSLLLEIFDGKAWKQVKTYDFDYTQKNNQSYSDIVNLTPASHTFPKNVEFRFRSKSGGSDQSFKINNYSIKTRKAMEDVTFP